MTLSPSTVRELVELDALAQEHCRAHAELIAARCANIPLSGAQTNTRTGMAEARHLCDLFYAASPTERRLILLNLNYAPIAPSQPSAFIRRADSWRLDTAVLRSNGEAVVRELERALGISRAQARRIITMLPASRLWWRREPWICRPMSCNACCCFSIRLSANQWIGATSSPAFIARSAWPPRAEWRRSGASPTRSKAQPGTKAGWNTARGGSRATRFSAVPRRLPHSQQPEAALLYSRA